ncbi:hypothetical protein [Clostridioides difficile]|nr:hypothetical protein [Clostridioides difficile]
MTGVPDVIKTGVIGPNDIAEFAAKSMCWSGYVSKHIVMIDA